MARENSDVDTTGVQQSSTDELAVPLQRLAASSRQQSAADLNTRQPGPLRDPVSKKLYYNYVPRPLTRLLGSPLAMTGKYSGGPHGERKVFGGWGDARPSGYEKGAPRTFHKGLDFGAPFGEAVLACGDGKITFVGAQSKEAGVFIAGPNADAQGNILDGKGAVALASSDVGFGGIFIYLVHNDDDFAGYRTEYFHLSSVNVKTGQKVSEGDIIGFIGKTGVKGIGPHLHFQTAYTAGKTTALVNPTSLVPNYWPGHTDSTNSDASKGLIMPTDSPALLHVASGSTANLINGMYRAVTMQNHDLVTNRQRISDHAERIAQVVNHQEATLYAAATAATSTPSIVESPICFDFDLGTWTDGKVT